MTCTDDLVAQVRKTLGDRQDDFDTVKVVDDLRARFGAIDSVDDVPRDAYWFAVFENDLTRTS